MSSNELNSRDNNETPYDAFLLVSFGGPEGPDDVLPFLENVLRGKNVPRERMMEVAEHYQHFGGVSPINQQNRDLLSGIESHFKQAGIDLPIYWGNRNWSPYFKDALVQMQADGRKRALAFFTSMFSCYSGCRQYRENISAAREQIASEQEGRQAPVVDKLRFGFNHPGFIGSMRVRVREAMEKLGDPSLSPRLLFTAHSIPFSMADNCDYVKQLREACRLIAADQPISGWDLVFQSRSGPPQQPWLEPDVCVFIRSESNAGLLHSAIILPVGFVSDHMEVLYDLDEEAAAVCQELNIPMARALTPGTHPLFIEMIGDLVLERLNSDSVRKASGDLGPWHDVCPSNCCLYTPQGRPAAATR